MTENDKTPSEIGQSLEEKMPDAYRQLLDVRDRLENHFRDMCDIEFAIQEGRLFVLNVRPGKRTPRANLKFLLQFLSEGKIGIRDVLVASLGRCRGYLQTSNPQRRFSRLLRTRDTSLCRSGNWRNRF